MKLHLESPIDLIVIIIFVILVGYLTFSSDAYTIESETPDTYWVKKTWWGIKEEYRLIKWFNGEWHAKDKNGEWYPFRVDDDSEPSEYVPVR